MKDRSVVNNGMYQIYINTWESYVNFILILRGLGNSSKVILQLLSVVSGHVINNLSITDLSKSPGLFRVYLPKQIVMRILWQYVA